MLQNTQSITILSHAPLTSFCIAISTALFFSGCEDFSLDEQKVVGKWSWSSIDATSQYVFKPDRTFVVLLPDKLNQTGEWRPAFSGDWALELGFLILEYRTDRSGKLPKKKDRIPVREVKEDKIVLRDGSYFERVRD